MPTLVLTTPSNPGTASWTDSTLIPGAGITAQKGATVVSGVYTLNFIGAGVAVAAGPAGIANITVAGGGGGSGTLQDAYDLGQIIDISNATGDLVFDSTSDDGSVLIGNGNDLTVTVNTGGGLWTQTSAGISLTAAAPFGFGNITLTSADLGSKIETTADGTVTTATATGTLFKASPLINPAIPPAAPAATLDLWGTLLSRLEPTNTLNAATVLQYTAFAITANTAIPALGAGDTGRTILIANASANPCNVTPPGLIFRTLSPGGGSVWIWLGGAINDWICLGFA